MERIKIDFYHINGSAPVLIDKYGIIKTLLPFNKVNCLKGYYRIDIQLLSTAGGGASFEIQNIEDKKLYLTLGDFNPRFSGVVKDPIIIWSGYFKNYEYLPNKENHSIVQNFKLGFGGFTRGYLIETAEIRPLKSKEILNTLIASRNMSFENKFNGLEIYRVDDLELEPIEIEYKNRKEFFEYQVLGGNILACIKRYDFTSFLINYHKDGFLVDVDNLQSIKLTKGFYIVRMLAPMP